jgi:aminoglycoside/choline kinase family phosphotransferase
VLQPSWPYLHELIRRKYPDAREIVAEPMLGGASTRRFFRVTLPLGRTAVAMFVPGAATHEIHKDPSHVRWPFLEVRDLLDERGIRVPSLLCDGSEEGWLLLEDLGDFTIANYLATNPQAKRPIYQMAVRDLARAQRLLAELPEACIVRARAFDRDLLRWEIDHFLEWAVLARGLSISAADRKSFEQIGERLAETIASWPRGFVHRDYQSRNLMVVDDPGGGRALAWVDFQDALLGPRVYDLVALLSDSYQEFDRAFIDERLEEYAAHAGLDAAERKTLRREFDLVTVQRKLKDAGRFIFIHQRNGNPSFLPFVEPTIAKARAAMERLSDDHDMRELAAVIDRVIER